MKPIERLEARTPSNATGLLAALGETLRDHDRRLKWQGRAVVVLAVLSVLVHMAIAFRRCS